MWREEDQTPTEEVAPAVSNRQMGALSRFEVWGTEQSLLWAQRGRNDLSSGHNI